MKRKARKPAPVIRKQFVELDADSMKLLRGGGTDQGAPVAAPTVLHCREPCCPPPKETTPLNLRGLLSGRDVPTS